MLFFFTFSHFPNFQHVPLPSAFSFALTWCMRPAHLTGFLTSLFRMGDWGATKVVFVDPKASESHDDANLKL